MFSFFTRAKPAAAGLPPLRLHNTLSGSLEVFTPMSREVKMYNCGPTVYGTQHIGNMRAAVFADTLRRTLIAWGHPVKQVINITDFGHLSGDNHGDADTGEDRMTMGLKREGMELTLQNMRTLATKYLDEYLADIEALGLARNNITFPRASDYIPEQIALIQTLEQKGYAYQIKSGVYFDTAKFAQYGKLGGINLSGQQEGSRVEQNKEKRNGIDFVLWKSDSALGWESPWGLGFPGWHIECTAMIFTLLGKQIDIHTGGIEHIPVHHNNEIAQAEAASGKRFVQYWLHNDHITIEGKKISKSLGNTIYLRNIVDRGFSPRALRYWFLTAHYRSSANFTWDALEGANTALARLTRLYFDAAPGGTVHQQSLTEFYAHLANDMDTPGAMAVLWGLVKNTAVSSADKKATLAKMDETLGLGLTQARPMQKLSVTKQTDVPPAVQALLKEREDARANKDFTKADILRNNIQDAGYEVTDTSDGQALSLRNTIPTERSDQ